MPSLRASLLHFRDRFWTERRGWLIAFLLVTIVFCVPPLRHTLKHGIGPKDYHIWQLVAHAVRDGQPLYFPDEKESPYNFFYPPAIATLFYAPLSYAGPVGLVAILCLLSAAGHLLALLLAVRFATGRMTGVHGALYVVPWLITLPFCWDIYALGQLNLTLLAVMLLGFLALEGRRPLLAGTLFALAAAAKAFPFTVIVYLVWRRYYLAALAMVLALATILVILPAPMRGFDRNLEELKIWASRMLVTDSSGTLANQPDRGYHYGNQTLLSVVNRLTRPLPVGAPQDGVMTVNVLSLSPRASFALAFGITGLIGLAFVFAMPHYARQTPASRALEYGILLILIVAFSPKAGSYYYCWTLPGFTLLLAAIFRRPRGDGLRRWLIAGLVASLLVLATALTQSFDRHAQAYGATLWGSLILAGTLLALLRTETCAALTTSGGKGAVERA